MRWSSLLFPPACRKESKESILCKAEAKTSPAPLPSELPPFVDGPLDELPLSEKPPFVDGPLDELGLIEENPPPVIDAPFDVRAMRIAALSDVDGPLEVPA